MAKTTQKLKPGTQIEVRGFDLSNQETWEPAKIGRMRKEYGPPPAGFHPVTFDGGIAKLLCHESRFRIISANRENV